MKRVLRLRYIFEISKHIVGLVAVNMIRLAQWRSRTYKGSHHQRMNESCFLVPIRSEQNDSPVIGSRMLAGTEYTLTSRLPSGSLPADTAKIRGCIIGELRNDAPFLTVKRSKDGCNWMGIAQTSCADSRSLVRSISAPQTSRQFTWLSLLPHVHNSHMAGDANARVSKFEFAAATKVSDVLTHALRGV